MQEPTPEQYNPPLTLRSHLWRTAVAVLVSAVLCATTAAAQWEQAHLLVWLDLALGMTALGLSFFRRRWPLTVAVLTSLFGMVSVSATGPAILAAVSLATRRRMWQIVLVAVSGMAGTVVFALVEPRVSDSPWAVTFGFGLAFTVAFLTWGMYLGSRRELLWTLRDKVERAEAEQELRVEQGRSTERARIAREMHDVLAHRISLISMHAGALTYRTDLSAEATRETAELIQATSHQALNDLRQVLGVLRGGEQPGTTSERPQPTFVDLAALIEEAETSGMRVRYDDRVVGSTSMPDRVGRTTYRIVQEGLTNARKHAPGVTVLVDVAGSPTSGVDIRIRNPSRALSGHTGVQTPGAGLGLVGLGERAKLAGGRLESGREGGTFELHGWLPWGL